MRAHRLQDVERRDRVLFQILTRMLRSEAHVGVGRQVKDELRAGHCIQYRVRLERVAFHKAESFGLERGLEESPLSSGEIVERGDFVAAGEEPIDDVAADEARAAGDKTFHEAQELYPLPF